MLKFKTIVAYIVITIPIIEIVYGYFIDGCRVIKHKKWVNYCGILDF